MALSSSGFCFSSIFLHENKLPAVHKIHSLRQLQAMRDAARRLRIVAEATNGRASETNITSLPPLSPKKKPPPSPLESLLKTIKRRIAVPLSSLPLAIAEMVAIAGLIAIGSLLPQDGVREFYLENYTAKQRYLGIFTGEMILALGLDSLYLQPYFLGLLALLGASLISCSWTTQLPIAKVARKWSFVRDATRIFKMNQTKTVTNAKVQDLGLVLSAKGYEVFMEGSSLYAFKGISGRFAPMLVHLSLLCVMLGGLCCVLFSYQGYAEIVQGDELRMGDILKPSSILQPKFPGLDLHVQLNGFSMERYANGKVSQFYSDITVTDPREGVLVRKVIRVNLPLRIAGATIYQTDWGLHSIIMRVNDSEPFSFPMVLYKDSGDDTKQFATVVPNGFLGSKGISVLAQDLDSVVVYGKDGQFVGVRRTESHKPIEVDGVKLVVDEIIPKSGFQMKIDPAIPLVYTGFGLVLLTSMASLVAHCQIWASQDGTSVILGGKVSRGDLFFENEIEALVSRVPEYTVDATE